MYFINIFDNTTQRNWREEFDSLYFFEKRIKKLKFSKKLEITSWGRCY